MDLMKWACRGFDDDSEIFTLRFAVRGFTPTTIDVANLRYRKSVIRSDGAAYRNRTSVIQGIESAKQPQYIPHALSRHGTGADQIDPPYLVSRQPTKGDSTRYGKLHLCSHRTIDDERSEFPVHGGRPASCQRTLASATDFVENFSAAGNDFFVAHAKHVDADVVQGLIAQFIDKFRRTVFGAVYFDGESRTSGVIEQKVNTSCAAVIVLTRRFE